MTGIDPNLWASLARQYTGGINAPVPGQQGQFAQVDASGTNLQYVSITTGLAACALEGQTKPQTTALTKDVYSRIVGTFAVLGSELPQLAKLAAGIGFTYSGNGGKIILVTSLRCIPASSGVDLALCWHVDGVSVGSPTLFGDDADLVGFATVFEVTTGEEIELKLTNTTNDVDALSSCAHVAAILLEAA